MKKYPKIMQFKDVITQVKSRSEFVTKDEDGNPIYDSLRKKPILTFTGTVKLHGTNAGVVVKRDGTVIPQSRERELSITNDNMGFASWCSQEKVKEFFIKQAETEFENPKIQEVVFFGEWAGQKIQKGVGISELEKFFALFEVALVEDDEHITYCTPYIVKNDELRIYHVALAGTYSITIDFNHPELSQNQLIAYTEKVEEQCPFAKMFGVEGVGEGIVWKCYDDKSDLVLRFKVKGEKHQKSKVKTLVPVNEEEIQEIEQFVDYALTENRLLQGLDYLKEMNLPLISSSIGEFIKWCQKDVIEEEKQALIANQLDIGKVKRKIIEVARNWYLKRL